jgi:hypothetical protein
VIQEVPPQRADQPFDERMRQRYVRDSLHLLDLEDPQVRLQLVTTSVSALLRG